jgi:uncharacterized protein (UPF0335 family)
MTTPPADATATDDRLRLLIERTERLNEEIKGVQDDRKDVFAEAKSLGYDVPAMKAIIKLRAMKPDDRMYQAEMLETYKSAMGLA